MTFIGADGKHRWISQIQTESCYDLKYTQHLKMSCVCKDFTLTNYHHILYNSMKVQSIVRNHTNMPTWNQPLLPNTRLEPSSARVSAFFKVTVLPLDIFTIMVYSCLFVKYNVLKKSASMKKLLPYYSAPNSCIF